MSRRYSRGHILFYFYFCKECSENICLERELNYLISHTTKLLWVIMFESGIPYYKVGGKQICMEMIYFFNSINLCFRRVSEKKTDKTSSGPDFSGKGREFFRCHRICMHHATFDLRPADDEVYAPLFETRNDANSD